MKNILIITSNKNIKSKYYKWITSYIKKRKVIFQVVHIEDSLNIDKYIKKDTLLISLGGDGTALKSMKIAWKYNLLFLPLGHGRVGYLVNTDKEFKRIFDKWLNNEYKSIKRKALLQNKNNSFPAFNEIVIIKNSPTRLLDLILETYDQKVKLRADGLIISTSLGSTAYNYSAGGPIVQNDIESIIITPISPFTKFPRSIVINKESNIKITIIKNQNFAIQFDGVVELESKLKEDIVYEYNLSNKSIKLLEDNTYPKLDRFLNQILR